MSGAVVEQKDACEFTLVASPRLGCRKSALYHYLLSKDGEACMAVLLRSRKITAINKKDTSQAILLSLPNKVTNDLYAHLPSEIRTKYPRYRLEDRHIRVDKVYGSKSKLWYQWHYTERINLDKGQALVVHVYFNYGTMVETTVKLGTGFIRQGYAFDRAISENCQDVLQIMLQAIEQMQSLKTRAMLEFETSVLAIEKCDLKTIPANVVNTMLVDAKAKFATLHMYQDDIVDKRLEQLETYVLNVRRHQEEHKIIANLSTSKPAPTTTCRRIIKKGAKTKVAPIKAPAVTNEHLQVLQQRYAMLHAQGANIKTAAQAKEFDRALQELKLEVEVSYVCNDNPAWDKLCNVLRLVIRQEPSLYELFKTFVYALNVQEATQLFSAVQADIAHNFYTEFLISLFKNYIAPNRELEAVKLCKFFFENAQDYRLLLSTLHTITFSFTADDGTSIGLSPLIQCPLLGYFELFKTILEQCANANFVGYFENGNSTPLLTLYCLMEHSDASTRRYILELLKYNVWVERSTHFAQPMHCKTQDLQRDKNLGELFANLSTMGIEKKHSDTQVDFLTEVNDIVHSYQESFGNSIYAGGPLAAYCQAQYQDAEVLAALIQRTKELTQLVYACGIMSFAECIFLHRYGLQKIGLNAEKDIVKLRKLVVPEPKVFKEGANFLGIYYNHDDGKIFENFRLLMTQTHAELSKLDTTQISELCTRMTSNRIFYESRGERLRALACERGILFAALYREPSFETHLLIAQTFINMGDMFMQAFKQEASNDHIKQAQVQYKNAIAWSSLSKFKSDLHSQKNVQQVKAYLQSIEVNQAATMTKQSLRHG